MAWEIEYMCEDVEEFVIALPPTLAAKYLWLTNLMSEFGPNLGMPHTRIISDGLSELRIKGKEGIARVFYCAVIGQRIMMLHGFIKKSQKAPLKELRKAKRRMTEVKENGTQ